MQSRAIRNGRQKSARVRRYADAARATIAEQQDNDRDGRRTNACTTGSTTLEKNEGLIAANSPSIPDPADASCLRNEGEPSSSPHEEEQERKTPLDDDDNSSAGLLELDDRELTTNQCGGGGGKDTTMFGNHSIEEDKEEMFQVDDTERAALELLSLCQETDSPLYMYDEIIRIFKRHTKTGNCHIQRLPSREKLMRKLHVSIITPRAFNHTLMTSTGQEIGIIKFNFLEQLKDLLSTSYFNDIENLCANTRLEERFDMYHGTPEDEQLEVCTGEWYKSTFEELGVGSPLHRNNKGSRQLLMPLIFYVDKTGTDVLQRYPLEPLMFTTALLRRDIRRKADCWRHVGFIPPNSVRNPESKSASEKLQGYHDCLSAMVLDELKQLQRNPPCIEVNLGGLKRYVTVRLPIAFVVGDQESQDALCCRKKPVGRTLALRVHRSCMCSQLTCHNTGDPIQCRHVSAKGGVEACVPIPKKVIRQLVLACTTNVSDIMKRVGSELESSCKTKKKDRHTKIQIEKKLHLELLTRRANLAAKILEFVFGLYPIKNSFDEVCFGSNQNGIYTATLNDSMHFNESGLILNIAQVAYGIVGATDKRNRKLEMSISSLFKNARSSVRSTFPRGFYRPGFTDLSLLTSGEKVGVVFALLMSLRMDDSIRVNEYSRYVEESQRKYMTFHLTPDDVALLQKEENEGRNPLHLFHLTSATPFLRDKVSAKSIQNMYSATKVCFQHISHHLKLHNLEEVLDLQLDALQIDGLAKTSWEVLKNIDEECYPNSHVQIFQLDEDLGDKDMFNRGEDVNGLYCYIPVSADTSSDFGCYDDDDIMNGRSFWFDSSALTVLTQQLQRVELANIMPQTAGRTTFSSAYGCLGTTASHANRNVSSHRNHKRQRKNRLDSIQYTRTNKEPFLVAESLRTATTRRTGQHVNRQTNFIAKHGREKKHKKPATSVAILTDVDSLCHVLEVCLLHHAFLHYSETIDLEHRRDLKIIQKGIEKYLSLVDQSIYRGDNTVDTATCKFHSHFQSCAIIPYYGDPSQYEAGSCERLLKDWAKKVSRTAQKNRGIDTFSFQTAARVSDYRTVTRALDTLYSRDKPPPIKEWCNVWHQYLGLMIEEQEEDDKDNDYEMGASGSFFFARNQPHYCFDVHGDHLTAVDRRTGKPIEKTRRKTKEAMIQHQVLKVARQKELLECAEQDGLNLSVINIWTEIMDANGNYLRATPHYPSVGPWYDWAFVHFIDATGHSHYIPCKCVLFYLDVHNEPCALVHGCAWSPSKRGSISSSLICDEWVKAYRAGYAVLDKVPLSSIQQGAYTFERCALSYKPADIPLTIKQLKPEEVDAERVVVVAPRNTWAMKFYEWCVENT